MKRYDSYKDSGIEWIREIPSHWLTLKFKRLFKVSSGDFLQSDDKEDNEAFGYPVYGGNGLRGYSKDFNNQGQLILIGRVGAKCGNIHLVNGKYWVSEHALRVLKRAEYNDFYMKYLLELTNFNQYAITTAQPLINSEIVLDRESILPPIEEQTAIANYLDQKTSQIDELIAKKERLIQLLEEERTANINQAVTKGLDSTVPMKDSGIEWLGEIPEHWEVSILKHILGTTKGFAFKSDQFTDKGIPIVKASDIKNKSIRLETTHFISEENAMEFNNVKLSAGDILISTVGSTPDVINSAVGQIGKVPIELDGALLNQNTVRLEVSDKKKIISKYLFFLIQNENYRTHLNLNAHGTANQASLKLVDLLSYKVALPPLNEQLTIVKHSKAENQRIQTIITKTRQEIELLKEYKTALISEVVTGKVDVRNEKLN